MLVALIGADGSTQSIALNVAYRQLYVSPLCVDSPGVSPTWTDLQNVRTGVRGRERDLLIETGNAIALEFSCAAPLLIASFVVRFRAALVHCSLLSFPCNLEFHPFDGRFTPAIGKRPKPHFSLFNAEEDHIFSLRL
jgi:hypothetical protein